MKNIKFLRKKTIGASISMVFLICSASILTPVINGQYGMNLALKKVEKQYENDTSIVLELFTKIKEQKKVSYNDLLNQMKEQYKYIDIKTLSSNINQTQRTFEKIFGEESFYGYLTFCHIILDMMNSSGISFKEFHQLLLNAASTIYFDIEKFNDEYISFEKLSPFTQNILKIMESQNVNSPDDSLYWDQYKTAKKVWRDQVIPNPFSPGEYIRCPFVWTGVNFDDWMDNAKDHLGWDETDIEKNWWQHQFILWNVILGSLTGFASFVSLIFNLGGFITQNTKYYNGAIFGIVFTIIFGSLMIYYDFINLAYFVGGILCYTGLEWFGSVEIVVYVYNETEAGRVGVDNCNIEVESADAEKNLHEEDWWNSVEKGYFKYELGEAPPENEGWYSLNERDYTLRWIKACPPPGFWNISIDVPSAYIAVDDFQTIDPIPSRGTLIVPIEAVLKE